MIPNVDQFHAAGPGAESFKAELSGSVKDFRAAEDFRAIARFGTSELPPPIVELRAGPVRADLVNGALRRITYGDVEIVRQVDFPIRDGNWATLAPVVIDEHIEDRAEGFRYERSFEAFEGGLCGWLTYEGDSRGTVVANAELKIVRDIVTCRTSFTVLHPLNGVAGQPMEVTSPSGHITQVSMPDEISPDQPLTDIAELEHNVADVVVRLTFAGEVFEMEDQRNWTDASFKTYGRPLREPYPYVLPAGSTLHQSVTIQAAPDEASLHHPSVAASQRVGSRVRPSSGSQLGASNLAPSTLSIGKVESGRVPAMLLAAEAGWLPNYEESLRLRNLPLEGILLRVSAANAAKRIFGAEHTRMACGGTLNLEIVLEAHDPVALQMGRIADVCTAAGVKPSHVLALPVEYLASHQPDGPWPTGTSPEDALASVRKAFPKSLAGSGMLTNFTELNRRRSHESDSDYFSHGTSATVHAAGDDSVIGTLEALPAIFATARRIEGSKPYRLGLTAIGMRSNPYGRIVTSNPDQQRKTMTTWDPRARSLLGAAWAAGVIAATRTFDIAALSLGAAVGPFGIVASPGPICRPWFDDHPEAIVYPLYHVINAMGPAGSRFHSIGGLPDGVVAVAASIPRSTSPVRVMLANLSGRSVVVTPPADARTAVLDSSTFDAATCDTAWLTTSMKKQGAAQSDLVRNGPAENTLSELSLEHTAVAFMEVPAP